MARYPNNIDFVIGNTLEIKQEIASSLGVPVNELKDYITWKRIGEIEKNAKFVANKNDEFPSNTDEYLKCFSPEDACQGALGDCYAIVAMMGIAMNTDVIKRLIPYSNCNHATMEYKFQFSTCQITVNDYLPVLAKKIGDKNPGSLIFCHSKKRKNVFWASLLEKALAMHLGGYGSLSGGQTANILYFLTGGIFNDFRMIEIMNEENNQHLLDVTCRQKSLLLKDLGNGQKSFFNETLEELFDCIKLALNSKFIVQVTAKEKSIIPFNPYGMTKIEIKSYVKRISDTGLLPYHAYLVTGITNGNEFICLHNPYNVEDAFKRKPEYQSTFRVMGKICPVRPGEFWLTKDEFIRYIQQVIIYNPFPENNLLSGSKINVNIQENKALFCSWKMHQCVDQNMFKAVYKGGDNKCEEVIRTNTYAIVNNTGSVLKVMLHLIHEPMININEIVKVEARQVKETKEIKTYAYCVHQCSSNNSVPVAYCAYVDPQWLVYFDIQPGTNEFYLDYYGHQYTNMSKKYRFRIFVEQSDKNYNTRVEEQNSNNNTASKMYKLHIDLKQ